LQFRTKDLRGEEAEVGVESGVLCFIQKLEKLVYLNHAMLQLTSTRIGVYRLQERQDPSNSSITIFTQAQRKE